MHELSIVQGIIDIAIDAANRYQVTRVQCVEVEIGQASGLVPDAMDFAWESAKKDTILQEASLVIKIIPLLVRCRACGKKFHPDDMFENCPGCGNYNPEIVSGKELRVTAIQG